MSIDKFTYGCIYFKNYFYRQYTIMTDNFHSDKQTHTIHTKKLSKKGR